MNLLLHIAGDASPEMSGAIPNVACLCSVRPGAIDRALAGAAARLAAAGVTVTGALQAGTEGTGHGLGRGRCDVSLTILPGGPQIGISQDRGAEARGCRLDAGALETAAAMVSRRLATGAEALILGRFGKQEAAGRGFRGLIAEAALSGIPVVVGVAAWNLPALEAFLGTSPHRLPARAATVADWLHAHARQREDGRQAG